MMVLQALFCSKVRRLAIVFTILLACSFSQRAMCAGSEVQIGRSEGFSLKIDRRAVSFRDEIFFCSSERCLGRESRLVSYARSHEKLAEILLQRVDLFCPVENFFNATYEEGFLGHSSCGNIISPKLNPSTCIFSGNSQALSSSSERTMPSFPLTIGSI